MTESILRTTTFSDGKTPISAEWLNEVKRKTGEVVSVKDFGAVADWDGSTGTNLKTSLDLALAALPSEGGTITIPPGEYCLSGEVVVDGNSDATNFSKKITIKAFGAKIYYTGSAIAFTFLDVNYPEFKGAQLYLVNDTAGVIGVQLKHSRWGEYDLEIFNGTNEVAAGGSNNIAWKLQSGPSDTFDNLYNKIAGRVRKTGWGAYLANDDTTASRNNANEFDVDWNSTNGIKLEGSIGNIFKGSFEVGTGMAVALLDNASGVHSQFNTFDFKWLESTSLTAWDTDVDSGCDFNNFIIHCHQYACFAIGGNQYVTINGAQSNTAIPTQLNQSEETFEAQMNGGYVGGVNYLQSSEDFSVANWTKTNSSVGAGAVSLPDGTSATGKNAVTISAANGNISQGVSLDSANKLMTASCWLSDSTNHTGRIQIYSNAGSGEGRTISVRITPTWRRYYVTNKFSSASGTSVSLFVYPAALDVATGSANVFGAQISTGYPGAYIKTGTNANVRAVGSRGLVATNNAFLTPLVAFSKYNDTGVTINNYRVCGIATAAPSSGTWQSGDRLFNSSPSVGAAKGWICTVSGTPGTWVSEGNL